MRARLRSGRIRDEVYRQMFRLEESRSGAEMDLALALLRAWLIAMSIPQERAEREWLKRISPICIDMIELNLRTEQNTRHRPNLASF